MQDQHRAFSVTNIATRRWQEREGRGSSTYQGPETTVRGPFKALRALRALVWETGITEAFPKDVPSKLRAAGRDGVIEESFPARGQA